MVSGTKKIKNGGRDVKKRFIRTRKGNIKFFFFFFQILPLGYQGPAQVGTKSQIITLGLKMALSEK